MSLYAALDKTRYINEHWQDNAGELYERVAFRNVIGKSKRLQSSGVAYARKAHSSGMLAKNRARYRILDSVSREFFPGRMRILTMPGLEWPFEAALINQRDYALHGSEWVANLRNGSTFVGQKLATEIYAVERDPAVYFGSINYIPAKRAGLQQLSAHSISTRKIKLYYLSDVETFIGDAACPEFDAAWLDFTGYMVPARLSRIRRFWREKCARQLAVTVLNARYPFHVKTEVLKHGSMEKWITNTLGGEVYDVHRYFDDYSAMLQIILRK